MRRVIQRTITTTKIVSLTITRSEIEEAVEYTLVDSAEQLNPGGDAPVSEQARVTLTPDDELPSNAPPRNMNTTSSGATLTPDDELPSTPDGQMAVTPD